MSNVRSRDRFITQAFADYMDASATDAYVEHASVWAALLTGLRNRRAILARLVPRLLGVGTRMR